MLPIAYVNKEILNLRFADASEVVDVQFPVHFSNSCFKKSIILKKVRIINKSHKNISLEKSTKYNNTIVDGIYFHQK